MHTKLHIFTIGHSTRSLEEFLAILKEYGITELVDIRTIPKSRHNPQFNHDNLADYLRNHHIGYRHQKNLGGLRHTHANSINLAWRNASFRGYADYMQTPEFQEGIQELIKTAQEKKVAIMCAEAVPWRCHRSLIGDALLAHGVKVDDIYSMASVRPHILTPWAVIQGTTISYPADSIKK
jgi:uncharacterized protein (DUF488 family)